MECAQPKSVIKLDELEKQIDRLAGMAAGPGARVSCHLDVGRETDRLVKLVRSRLTARAREASESKRPGLQMAQPRPPHYGRLDLAA